MTISSRALKKKDSSKRKSWPKEKFLSKKSQKQLLPLLVKRMLKISIFKHKIRILSISLRAGLSAIVSLFFKPSPNFA